MPPDTLELESRRRLYLHLIRHPGKYLRELQRDLDMAMGALEYHLSELEKSGLVTVLQDANKRFFPNRIDRRDRRLLAFLRQRIPRRVLILLLQHDVTTKTQLLRQLDTAPSTLNYHLRRLVDAGLIETARDGRDAVYRARDATHVTRLLVAYRATLLDRMVDAFIDGVGAIR